MEWLDVLLAPEDIPLAGAGYLLVLSQFKN